jgi:hypothetical protein
MSLHISVVAVQGDHLDQAGELLRAFGYEPGAEWIEVAGWEAAGRYLADHGCKALYFHEGWTVIVDPELVLMLDEDALADLSRRLASQVCGLVCEGVSGTYGFNLFHEDRKVRGFCATDGVIAEDLGEPLPEEAHFDRARVSEAGVIGLVAGIGFDYWGLERADRILVFNPGRRAPADVPMSSGQGGPDRSEPKTPWWRFW